LNRRRFLVGLSLVVPTAHAAGTQEMPLVGMLRVLPETPYDPAFDALREALAARGYQQGVNIRLEPRFANGYPARLPKLADELVRQQAKVIVAVNEA
jgi:ABC-type uncharacterized transport system substrate-binding protein